MAKIPVEKETDGGWWKWLLGLLLLLLVIWILWAWLADDDEVEPVDGTGVEQVEPEGTRQGAPGTARQGVTGAAAMSISDILSNPDQYVGQTFPETEVNVGSVPTDRGFWIAEQGDSLFAIIIDQPQEQPKDINPGQTLRVQNGTLRDSEYLSEMPGVPLDQNTQRIAEQQDVFLVVDERYLNVRQGGTPQPGTDPAEGVQ